MVYKKPVVDLELDGSLFGLQDLSLYCILVANYYALFKHALLPCSKQHIHTI